MTFPVRPDGRTAPTLAKAAMPLALVPPSLDRLDGYAAALRGGWSPNNLRDVSSEQLAALERDPAAFVTSLTSRDGLVLLPDGRYVPKLPFVARWMWDGEFSGSISLRWQEGTDALPDHVLGHIGYTVVPKKRGQGYASEALRLMLDEAHRAGLGTIEITCSPDNAASRRVIEKNGGRYAGEFVVPLYGERSELKFTIDVRRTMVTPRLILSAITERDFADLLSLTTNPDVGGRLKHGVLTEAETREQLQTYLALWAEHGYGVFVIRRRETGAFAGIAGLWEHDDGLGVALRYAVMPDHRGGGIAREAGRAVLRFAKRENIHPIIAVTRESNIASRRILADLGFGLRELKGPPDRRVAVYAQAESPP